jgi:hypothetical protein
MMMLPAYRREEEIPVSIDPNVPDSYEGDYDRDQNYALKTIIDFYEKSRGERAERWVELFYLLEALDYLHDDLLAWAHKQQGGK